MNFKFKDGQETDRNCPMCGTKLHFEMSFLDRFSHTTGHYTIDNPIIICADCNYSEDYEGEE